MDKTQLIGWSAFLLSWVGIFAFLWWMGEGLHRGWVMLGWTVIGLALIYGLMHLMLRLA